MNVCNKHREYTGTKRRPSSHCLPCWLLWLENQPDDQPVTFRELKAITLMLAEKLKMANDLARTASQGADAGLYVANKYH